MKKIAATFVTLIIPSLLFAQTASNVGRIDNANDLVKKIVAIGDVVIYLLISFAVIYIIWYTVLYFIKGEKGDESRKVAGTQIIWGIVGLAIILSIWGLVNILLGTFSVNNQLPLNRVPSADFINEE
jgi:hypothetical protein